MQVPLPKTHLRQGSLGPARGCREKEPGPNPKFAEHVNVPLRPLYGLIRCSASQNCRAEHRDVPLRGVLRGWGCAANFGLGRYDDRRETK